MIYDISICIYFRCNINQHLEAITSGARSAVLLQDNKTAEINNIEAPQKSLRLV